MMDRTAVAHALEQMASLLELKGESPYRVRAFRTAARAVANLAGDLGTALNDGSLAATKGIGPAILQIVTDLVHSGRSSVYEELREQVPPGLVEMLGVSGLGVARVKQIHEQLGIESLGELEEAARDGRLARVPGFGPKSCENVLKGLARLRRAATVRLVHHAAREAEDLRSALEKLPGVIRAVLAGEVRRRLELVRDLVVVLVAEVPPTEILARLAAIPGVDEFAGQDERRATLRFAGGTLAQVVVATPANFGAVLVMATGSEGHVLRLASYAEARGYQLKGGALWRGSTFVPTPTEAALYHALGLPEIPPELREDRGELALAERGLPRLVEAADLQGFLHCHTGFSDGLNTIEELALACREAGYRYLGITDHSSSATYAGGMLAEDLRRQWDQVDQVNARLEGIRVLKGIEVDILEDGRLDYGDEILSGFDFVIASVHTHFHMSREKMTARLVRAMESPWLTIVGHPTGRLLLRREPYPLDLDTVFTQAAACGVALEINADPHRLDLDWRVLDGARRAGVIISIGADAHSVAGLENVTWGLGIARKAGLGPEHILNTRSVDEFLRFAAARRRN
jgi:DNA polymerase (family 10)